VSKQQSKEESRVAEKSGTRTASPPMFKVLMHNDDYTTMEFVVQVLETVFRKSPAEANQIMLNIHFKGIGMCGAYPFQIAETKVARVHSMSREEGFPLKCSIEEE
jgi:ATP-dependent Clp protease adaptor protein ClpS